MKLLYLYIRDYKILKDIEFNFDSEYRFKFDKESRVLSLDNTSDSLPNDFFTKNKSSNVVIESISAIIGNNGAGKTSIADFLHVLSLRDGIEHIIIWKSETGLNCDALLVPEKLEIDEFNKLVEYLTKYNKKTNSHDCFDKDLFENYKKIVSCYYDKDKINIKSDEERKKFAIQFYNPLRGYNLNFDFHVRMNFTSFEPQLIYSSNFYSPLHSISTANSIKDISTSYLMNSDCEKYTNSIDKNTKTDKVTAHAYKDLQRNVEFFSSYYSHTRRFAESLAGDFFDDLNLPRPLGALVYVNESDLDLFRQNASKRKTKRKTSLYKLQETIIQIIKIIYPDDNSTFISKAICCFLGNHFRYVLQSNTPDMIISLYNKTTSIFLEKLKNNNDIHFFLFLDFLKNHISECGNTSYKEKNHSEHFNIGRNIYEPFHQALKLFEILERRKDIIINNHLYFDLKDNSEIFIKFTELYFKTHSITHFFNFTWNPAISAGEYSQLNIYSRLFDLKKFSEISKEFIVFFDEIEITIHPELQRTLVSNIITFFETFFSNCKIHLLFASHSPVLLSDIPKSNVCFIERIKDKVEISHPEIDNTFAANIHSLYKHSFFMKEGTIGEFASNKIKDLIKKIDNSNNIIEEMGKIDKIIRLIGEPVIKKKLHDYLEDKISKENIDRQIEYHRKAIAHLENDKRNSNKGEDK